MPGARCTRGLMCNLRTERAHEHTGTDGTLRHSLRNGFTAYAVLSPATNSSCHRRWRIKADQSGRTDFASAQLGTSNGCQDHTVLPYASAPYVLRAMNRSRIDDPPCDQLARRRCRVHHIPHQRPWRSRYAPPLGGMAGILVLICPTG